MLEDYEIGVQTCRACKRLNDPAANSSSSSSCDKDRRDVVEGMAKRRECLAIADDIRAVLKKLPPRENPEDSSCDECVAEVFGKSESVIEKEAMGSDAHKQMTDVMLTNGDLSIQDRVKPGQTQDETMRQVTQVMQNGVARTASLWIGAPAMMEGVVRADAVLAIEGARQLLADCVGATGGEVQEPIEDETLRTWLEQHGVTVRPTQDDDPADDADDDSGDSD